MATAIIIALYALGYILSYSMLRIEHEAEGRLYTRIDRVANITFSLLSFVSVLVILIAAWFKRIGTTGYWTKPVKQPK